MSDDKQPETIKLVAVERGFAMGRMVHPGETFEFRVKTADGKDRKLPKWAAPAASHVPKKPAVAGDLKPKDAQAAVKKKAAVLTGNESSLA
jgi:hypothetical protein